MTGAPRSRKRMGVATSPELLLRHQVVGRLALQDGQAGVVVRELRQVGQRDLAGDDRVVPADVGLRVPGPMLELHAEPHPELLEVAPQRLEVDPELDRKGTRLKGSVSWIRGAGPVACAPS